ncbi:MAG: MBL fold metallo-hydrolase [Gammaproteobacteria bacterium]|nr:MBL fold metallo-hydrolase [Gammaproteobacteria bacterium]NND40047.1 MBL fold metallo-hydrolase [Pseudomonadales bacterium]MBT8150184.1 MBL fold metallo-hydrolase [Gammaproteobacteria bacterium]NNL11234.1 MBL fold metallo-hydrolase [Pseudomonadales bacterium]NNM10923.1 MBL fold metallo-hydrolase [Pseudomonadales bacterium]
MTAAGTNSYVVGREQLVVVDPGPAIDSHIDALAAQVGDRLAAIVVTHTHPDHSPAAKPLADRTGAPLYGALSYHEHFQDHTFAPDHVLVHDSCVPAGDMSLRAIHTPGHVDNHFCFLLEEHRIIMAGDHLMQGSTVVIAPPQGDMAEYILSLQRLLEYQPDSIAPAHGQMMTQPAQEVAALIKHRHAREEKIFDVCEAMGEASTDALLPRAYDDVDVSLHGIARYSLLAHLLKLERDQRVVRINSNGDEDRLLDSADAPWQWRCC